jgi:hypothetical protein
MNAAAAAAAAVAALWLLVTSMGGGGSVGRQGDRCLATVIHGMAATAI